MTIASSINEKFVDLRQFYLKEIKESTRIDNDNIKIRIMFLI